MTPHVTSTVALVVSQVFSEPRYDRYYGDYEEEEEEESREEESSEEEKEEEEEERDVGVE